MNHFDNTWQKKYNVISFSGALDNFVIQERIILLFQILWKSRCYILVTFPSHLKKIRFIYWSQKVELRIFSLDSLIKKIPQYNFSHQNNYSKIFTLIRLSVIISVLGAINRRFHGKKIIFLKILWNRIFLRPRAKKVF